jgi:transcriptional regulator with XRE-family HTH domain
MSKFWDRVKILMRAPSVVDLANQLEVKRSTLSSWIHTDRRPPMSVLLKISEKAGVTIEQLEYGLDYKLQDEEKGAQDMD